VQLSEKVGLCRGKRKGKAEALNFGLCETAFNLKNIVQTYKNLRRLTRTKTLLKKKRTLIFLIIIIYHKVTFARIFFKNFYFFSKIYSPAFSEAHFCLNCFVEKKLCCAALRFLNWQLAVHSERWPGLSRAERTEPSVSRTTVAGSGAVTISSK